MHKNRQSSGGSSSSASMPMPSSQLSHHPQQPQNKALPPPVNNKLLPPPIKKDVKHWSTRLQETVVSIPSDGGGGGGQGSSITIKGGADTGFFCYVGDVRHDEVKYHSGGKLHSDDLILEIQGQKVSGYTLRDVNIWLKQVSQNGAPVLIKTLRSGHQAPTDCYLSIIRSCGIGYWRQSCLGNASNWPGEYKSPRNNSASGMLPRDLRQYLNTRFLKGSVDHDLQQTIRDNLYMRTVPCTTRCPRPGEINGVHYTFLTAEEFVTLEKNGSLLESGIFDGNHYGTPKPPKEPNVVHVRRTGSAGSLLFGNSNQGETKRKLPSNSEMSSSKSSLPPFRDNVPVIRQRSLEKARSSSNLGPLPGNWETAYTADGQQYFINHDTETTDWIDPRLSHLHKSQTEDYSDDEPFYREYQHYDDNSELPFGWEKVEDSHYGTYYIDHVNKRTQYENPVAQAKKSQIPGLDDVIGSSSTFPRQKKMQEPAKRSASESDMNGHILGSENKMKPFFTKNPSELKGEMLKTSLIKSVRGFGFTIVGGDHSDQEFLQVKNVVPNGPAYTDGRLKTGDILVYVNDDCVLGYTHQDVILLFQAIPPGEEVSLTVCRGYMLPFDPDDPNTEIVTRVAVSLPPDSGTTNTGPSNSIGYGSSGNMDQLNTSQKSLKSLPDLARSAADNNSNLSFAQRSHSGDVLNTDNTPDVLIPNSNKPEILVVNIIRGATGFGFTIADSSYGQRVKQIFEKTRCKNLMEGDILLEINSTNVKDMAHADVVQVLKDCPKGEETAIVVQRGGISSPGKTRKSAKLIKSNSEGSRPKNPPENNVPGAYFFNSSQEQVSDREDDDEESEGQLKSPTVDFHTRKAPTSSDQRSKYLSDHRPKTPTRTAVMKTDSRSRTATIGRPSFSNNFSKKFDIRKDYMTNADDNWSYNEQRSFEREYYPSYEYSTRPPPGPRSDPFRQDYTVSRTDHRFRTDMGIQRQNTMQSFQQEYDRSHRYDYGTRTEGIRPGQFRSRTPGPELMNRSLSGESRHEPNRPKTPTAQDMRSKTPLPTSNHNHTSASDFPLTSRYQNAPSSTWGMNGHRQAFAHKAWAYSSLDHGTIHPLRRESSLDNPAYPYEKTYSSNNNYAPNLVGGQGTIGSGTGRPSRQSTSFENEEPTPSNLTRIPKRYPPPSSNSFHHLPGSQSPRSPNRFPEYDEGLRHMEMLVILRRQESGFGFRIIGGTEEGSQVSVGHIVPGGAADLDGRLRTGDEIIYVDSHCVLNASHHRVVQLMGCAALNGRVSLRVRRRLLTTSISVTEQPFYRAAGVSESYPYDVTVTRREHEGFGFVIISSVSKAGSTIGEFIGRILENSPAERCNRLHVGDRILAVNNVDISHMHHEEIVNLIKESEYSVTLTIGSPQGTNPVTTEDSKQNTNNDQKTSGASPTQQNGEIQTSKDDASSTTSTSQRSSAGSMINAMAYPAISESDISHRSDHSPYHQPTNERYSTTQHAERPKDMSRPPRIQNHQSSQENEEEIYSVELHRGTRGFGFSIRGGREFNNMPLYVLRIADGGTADLDSNLRVGDQILEINGYNTNNITHQEAIDIIQNGGNSVQMLVKRTGKPPPSFDGLPSPTSRTPGTLSMANGPIGHSSPHMGRRKNPERPSDYFPEYSTYSRNYPNY
ncbi:membrane-associated guanylate kinase, WW and PDZ domain-containing protein 1 isoform X2 [Octopus bimaculoides]|uniref:membrane-associated guanylate kinase, WW and PDZ domain-containing protein 1 isoform X2 n=1 Tax=Octopus bimaculoides TaxID=37653 RepID=UPI0022E2BFF9|nr:membrane-associated guanylate kinase, WW and PDZ domain-containing protein 1 isoform X2 [Octopus bimaculoides]